MTNFSKYLVSITSLLFKKMIENIFYAKTSLIGLKANLKLQDFYLS